MSFGEAAEEVSMTRAEIAEHIVARLRQEGGAMRSAFNMPDRVPTCYVDDLLPDVLARRVFAAFPETQSMMFKNSIKERKYVSAQMDEHDPILEDCVYAFQDARVVTLIGEITGLRNIEPDAELYAGGISAMPKGCYLRPHLDNSHNGKKSKYRVLNLLYYVTPAWREEFGGNLQLWDQGPGKTPRTIPSVFNRLVLMITNGSSWHSVDEVLTDGSRCCVSNYYFSKTSPEERDYFHATSFRGEPGEVFADAVMRVDNLVRTTALKMLGEKIYKNPHVFKKERPAKD
jgi:Rps23 Pro-64 3,4-dihydroxylase Tpa1-like proline 4-hydroxylase